MTKIEFDAFIQIKISDLVDLIMDREKIGFEEAIEYLYSSALYTLLLRESTKLWHLSSMKLLEMLLDEKKNKQLILPDYV